MLHLNTLRIARPFVVLSALLASAGCEGFVGDDPMNHFGGNIEYELDQILDHPTSVGVLAMVNDASFADVAFLDDGLMLDARAAERIVSHRQGADGFDGTADDDIFGSVTELDAIPYVGESALEALGEGAWEFDYVPAMMLEGVLFTADEVANVLLFGNEGSVAELDDGAKLDVRAAESIVSGRPYHHLSEIAARPHVGGSALEALVLFSTEWVQ